MISITPATVAIIGAGPSGLAAAKEALECGLDPTVLEKGNAIGGLWKPGSGSVWDSMQTNISHHTCMFSDFEWKEDIQDFPNQAEVYEYLCSYANTFKIAPHVRLHSEVKKIEKDNEKWLVDWLNKDGQTESKTFHHVIVCSGIFSKAFVPNIPGLESFKKTIIHANEYKTPDAFEEKTVAIIGNAFSGCEIAVDIAAKAKQVINIIHRPMWILPRYLPNATNEKKLPADLIFYSRAAASRSEGINPLIINERKNNWFNTICKQGQTCPDLEIPVPSSQPPFVTISDSYLEKIQVGKITITKGSISQITEDTLFIEGKDPIKADALVFCTGYRADIPFFNAAAQEALDFQADDPLQPFIMHKTVFHPNFPGLAFVGMYRGPFFGAMELQARMACMTFSGKIPYPPISIMSEGIHSEKEIRNAIPRPQFPHGAYVNFSDDLAMQIGVLPDFEKMKTEEPQLFNQLWNGPFTTASFRLTGFGSNPEMATKIIERINKAYTAIG